MTRISLPAGADDPIDAAGLMGPLTDLVARAGAAILAVNRARMVLDEKADGSPVTEADLAADAVIAAGLARLLPHLPALSEERIGTATPPYQGSFILIDPLDGTKEYVAGRNEFTVNVALITDGVPILGIVGAPALGLIWRGLLGKGAERLTVGRDSSLHNAGPIRTRPLPASGKPWTVAVSRSHGNKRTEDFIDSRPGAIRQPLGSAVKFCRVAEGAADIYPRLAPTCEWDIAAGHAVLAAAGGKTTDSTGADLRFGGSRPDFIMPEFIAWGDPSAVQPS